MFLNMSSPAAPPSWVLLFVPSLAVFVNVAMWVSALPAILNARITKNLGDLNPLPLAVMFVQCVGWVMYGGIIKDYFIYFANLPGVCLGLFYVISAIALSTKNKVGEVESYNYRSGEWFLIGGVLFWLIVGLIVMSVEKALGETFLGGVCMSGALLYYIAPLSSAWVVITTKNSASLYLPMLIANLVNAALWFIYGFYIGNVFIYGPNAAGATLSFIQIILSQSYPNKNKESGAQLLSGIYGGRLSDSQHPLSENPLH